MEYEIINDELRAKINGGQHDRLRGDISGLRGYISSGLRGDISSGLRGDIRGLRGYISSGLRGDISGLRGYISSGLRGDISLLYIDIAAGKYPGLEILVASPEEVARLDEVREIILKKPERLKMTDWHSGNWTPDHTPEEEHSCGSAHCIAGWIQALSPDPEMRKIHAQDAGAQLCPTAAHMFFTTDAIALKWFEERAYAPIKKDEETRGGWNSMSNTPESMEAREAGWKLNDKMRALLLEVIACDEMPVQPEFVRDEVRSGRLSILADKARKLLGVKS